MTSLRGAFGAFTRHYASSFRGIPRRVWLLCAVFLVNRAGTMVLPFLSLYVTLELGVSKADAGWILAAFGLGSVLGSYCGGKLTVRLGPVAVQKLTLIFAGAGFLLLSQLQTFAAFTAGIFAVSLFGDGFRPAAMAAVAEAAPVEVRTRSLTLVRLAVNLGMSIGPAAGGMLAAWDYRWLFVADALTCWMAAALLFVMLPASREPRRPLAGQDAPAEGRPASLPAWRDPPFLAFMGVCFLVSCIFFQLVGAFPLYLNQACGLSERTIGLLLGFNALLIVVLEMPMVHRLEQGSLMRLVGSGAIFLGLGFGLLPLSCWPPFLLLTVVLWTIGEMVTLPFTNALVAQRAGEGRTGEYMGFFTATFSTSLLLAPPAGLWVYEHFGAAALWYGVGLIGPLCWLLCRWLEPRFR